MDESIRPRTPLDTFQQALDIASGDAAHRAREVVLEQARRLDAEKIRRHDDRALRDQIKAHPEQWI